MNSIGFKGLKTQECLRLLDEMKPNFKRRDIGSINHINPTASTFLADDFINKMKEDLETAGKGKTKRENKKLIKLLSEKIKSKTFNNDNEFINLANKLKIKTNKFKEILQKQGKKVGENLSEAQRILWKKPKYYAEKLLKKISLIV